jgi:hypothetical protein
VEFYEKKLKPLNNVELVFFSKDEDEKGMLDFMGKGNATFPAVEFKSAGESKDVSLLARHFADFVPQFVLLDATGKKLHKDDLPETDAGHPDLKAIQRLLKK